MAVLLNFGWLTKIPRYGRKEASSKQTAPVCPVVHSAQVSPANVMVGSPRNLTIFCLCMTLSSL